ncbi:hypothetical protein [Bacillus timonensis]|uniref:hypothetical protein n=1 Tax=Bacillus timonensis TaxID=1033734 RepID=UPI000289A20E|nr:hypothetical protein [Bacillus timonensis]
MKKNISDENIMLKQKIIHFQAEVSRYKEKLKRYEEIVNVSDKSNQVQEKQQLEDQVAELTYKVTALTKQVEELQLENKILKENRTYSSEPSSGQEEKKHSLDTWFVNNLKNQNAIARPNRTDNDK